MKKTTTTTATATKTATKKANDWRALCQKLEGTVNADALNTPEGTSTLYQFATAASFSVLKRVIDPQGTNGNGTNGGTVTTTTSDGTTTTTDGTTTKGKAKANDYAQYLEGMRRDTARATGLVSNFWEAFGYNDGFEVSQHLEIEDAEEAILRFTKENFGEGLDLVQDAVVATLEEIDKAKKRGEKVFSLEKEYTGRKLKSQVVSLDAENVEYVDDTAKVVVWIFRHIRKAIDQTGAVAYNPKSGYSYLEDFVHDDKDDGDGEGREDVVYRRLPKYSNLAGCAVAKVNGDYAPEGVFTSWDGVATADEATAKHYAELIKKLGLSTRQNDVLELKMRGYTNREIAKKIHCGENSVKGSLSQIKEKANRIGLNPEGKAKAARSHHKKA